MSASVLQVAEAARIMRERFRSSEHIYLYAIQQGDDGPVKIGLAQRPAQRLSTLQCGNPATLHGLAAWRALPLEEAQLHAQLAPLRVRGEWFAPAPELLELVERLGGDWEDW